MSIELKPWLDPMLFGDDSSGEEASKDQSPLAVAIKRAKVGFTVWDVRLQMEAIQQQVENAPNIDHDNELHLVHCISTERFWRLLNNIPDGVSLQKGMVTIPIEEAYKFKSEVSRLFSNGNGAKK